MRTPLGRLDGTTVPTLIVAVVVMLLAVANYFTGERLRAAVLVLLAVGLLLFSMRRGAE
ncbi:hypothetical protein JCM17823_21560 [Halorubrum gandharaense]